MESDPSPAADLSSAVASAFTPVASRRSPLMFRLSDAKPVSLPDVSAALAKTVAEYVTAPASARTDFSEAISTAEVSTLHSDTYAASSQDSNLEAAEPGRLTESTQLGAAEHTSPSSEQPLESYGSFTKKVDCSSEVCCSQPIDAVKPSLASFYNTAILSLAASSTHNNIKSQNMLRDDDDIMLLIQILEQSSEEPGVFSPDQLRQCLGLLSKLCAGNAHTQEIVGKYSGLTRLFSILSKNLDNIPLITKAFMAIASLLSGSSSNKAQVTDENCTLLLTLAEKCADNAQIASFSCLIFGFLISGSADAAMVERCLAIIQLLLDLHMDDAHVAENALWALGHLHTSDAIQTAHVLIQKVITHHASDKSVVAWGWWALGTLSNAAGVTLALQRGGDIHTDTHIPAPLITQSPPQQEQQQQQEVCNTAVTSSSHIDEELPVAMMPGGVLKTQDSLMATLRFDAEGWKNDIEALKNQLSDAFRISQEVHAVHTAHAASLPQLQLLRAGLEDAAMVASSFIAMKGNIAHEIAQIHDIMQSVQKVAECVRGDIDGATTLAASMRKAHRTELAFAECRIAGVRDAAEDCEKAWAAIKKSHASEVAELQTRLAATRHATSVAEQSLRAERKTLSAEIADLQEKLATARSAAKQAEHSLLVAQKSHASEFEQAQRDYACSIRTKDACLKDLEFTLTFMRESHAKEVASLQKELETVRLARDCILEEYQTSLKSSRHHRFPPLSPDRRSLSSHEDSFHGSEYVPP